MSTNTAPIEAPLAPARLGSFLISERINASGAPEGRVYLRVTGTEDTGFGGRAGIATCILASDDTEAQADADAELANVRQFSHPGIAPIIESGVAGFVRYWVHDLPDGEPMDKAGQSQTWSVAMVGRVIGRIGGALQAAHDAGISHGAVRPQLIFVAAPETPVLTGLGAAGQGAPQDQADLARVAIDLLAGKPWREPAPDIESTVEFRVIRAQRLREWLGNCTERVAVILSRATDPHEDRRFVSVAEFIEQFDSAIRLSAEDLVQGAYEAISARNPEMARLIADKAAAYDPECDGLDLLNMQLRGGSPFGEVAPGPVTERIAGKTGGINVPEPAQSTAPFAHSQQPLLPAELTQGLPPEFLQSIAPQFAVTPAKKGMNPVFVLVMGAAGLLLLLAAAGFATVLMSGK